MADDLRTWGPSKLSFAAIANRRISIRINMNSSWASCISTKQILWLCWTLLIEKNWIRRRDEGEFNRGRGSTNLLKGSVLIVPAAMACGRKSKSMDWLCAFDNVDDQFERLSTSECRPIGGRRVSSWRTKTPRIGDPKEIVSRSAMSR